MAVDEQRLNAFLGKAVGDLGAAVSAVLVSIGDELGFYKALATGRSATSAPGKAWSGANTISACSTAPSASFAPATTRTC
jgi:hypothetical protein